MAQKCHFYLGRLLKSVQSATKELAKSTCSLKDQTLVSISPSATLHKPQYFLSGKNWFFFSHQRGQNLAWSHLPSLTPPSSLFLLMMAMLGQQHFNSQSLVVPFLVVLTLHRTSVKATTHIQQKRQYFSSVLGASAVTRL